MKHEKIILIIMICILLVGCGKKTNKQEKSEISNIKDNQVSKLTNYKYTVSYINKVDNNETITMLNCDNDLKNNKAYCYINDYYYDVEKYVDYSKKTHYFRYIYPDSDLNDWQTLSRYYNNNINHFFNIVDKVKIEEKEEQDEYTIYKGTTTSIFNIALLLQELTDRIDIGNIDRDIIEVPVEILVDKDKNIVEINTRFRINENIKIVFKDFNTDINIEIPKDLKK